jgi:hypothetical protein
MLATNAIPAPNAKLLPKGLCKNLLVALNDPSGAVAIVNGIVIL